MSLRFIITQAAQDELVRKLGELEGSHSILFEMSSERKGFIPVREPYGGELGLETEGFRLYLGPGATMFLENRRLDYQDGKFGLEAIPLSELMEQRRYDDPFEQEVQAFINAEINPGIVGHGGYLELEKIEERVAYVRFLGNCSSCALSGQYTLAQTRKHIMEEFPSIRQVQSFADF